MEAICSISPGMSIESVYGEDDDVASMFMPIPPSQKSNPMGPTRANEFNRASRSDQARAATIGSASGDSGASKDPRRRHV